MKCWTGNEWKWEWFNRNGKWECHSFPNRSSLLADVRKNGNKMLKWFNRNGNNKSHSRTGLVYWEMLKWEWNVGLGMGGNWNDSTGMGTIRVIPAQVWLLGDVEMGMKCWTGNGQEWEWFNGNGNSESFLHSAHICVCVAAHHTLTSENRRAAAQRAALTKSVSLQPSQAAVSSVASQSCTSNPAKRTGSSRERVSHTSGRYVLVFTTGH